MQRSNRGNLIQKSQNAMTQEILGTNILIAGYGREGKSVIKYLESLDEKFHITVADTHKIIVEECSYPTITGHDYLMTAKDYDTVVRSPGIPLHTPGLSEAKHITSATNIFFSICPGTIIGITGTKGKSTTTALTHHLLKAAGKDTRLVGNIGQPALDHLIHADANTIFVMELSSYQLEDIHYSPHIAVMLPILQEHIPHHGSIEQYVAAKAHITDALTTKDFLVYDATNDATLTIATNARAITIPFDTHKEKSHSVWLEADGIFTYDQQHQSQRVIKLEELPLTGPANLRNTIASLTTVSLIGVAPTSCHEALKIFEPLPHRLEIIRHQDITYINDSLATTPEATINAMASFPQAKVLIAGGFDRDLDFTKLGQALAASSIKHLILFPDTGTHIENALKAADAATEIQVTHVDTMKEAVTCAKANLEAGDTCLMSPASASFNLFKDYEDRGNQFKQAVTSA